jgi:hypothetical protein
MTGSDGATSRTVFIAQSSEGGKKKMASGNVDYNAVLADLEARKTQIDSAIAAVKNILASPGVLSSGGSEGVIRPEDIPPHAFLSLSIPDATKKFLGMVKSKQALSQIMQALEKGGLPPAKYNTVYSVLRRRQQQVGDVFQMDKDWALTEWYPNNPNITKRAGRGGDEPAAQRGRAGKVKRKGGRKRGKGTIGDAAARILKEAGSPLHVRDIRARLAATGKETSESSLRDLMTRKDTVGRFELLGKGLFALAGKTEATEQK